MPADVYEAALPSVEERKVIACLFVLPFSQTTDKHTAEYWTNHFEQFIKPAIEKAVHGNTLLGYQAVLANPPVGDIIKEVFKNLQEADVVLADITDFNPNVVYELAIRQCLLDRTLVILEEGTEKPFFYLQNYKVIKYAKNSIQDGDRFKEDIQRGLIKLKLTSYDSSDNPISDYFSKTGQAVSISSSAAPEIALSSERDFTTIYVPATNNQRNASKQLHMQEAKEFIRLLASSGYAYFAPVYTPFRGMLEERLKAGIPTQIILVNPWSESRVFLSLAEHPQSLREQVFEQLKQGSIDPVALIEQSIYYQAKYSISMRGYSSMKQRFGNLIEVHICNNTTATILLTEKTGFFEPYVHVNLQERMSNAMITFEVEFPHSSYFYRHCKDYFESLWSSSVPYETFVQTEHDRKKELRGYYGWNTNSPGSTA